MKINSKENLKYTKSFGYLLTFVFFIIFIYSIYFKTEVYLWAAFLSITSIRIILVNLKHMAKEPTVLLF